MEKYRKQLNEIDELMLDLFIKRLDIVKQIGKYKVVNNIPVLDEKRESEIIEKGLIKVDNLQYKQYYKRFITLLLDISKDLQSQ